MEHAVITGATGLIGLPLVNMLLCRGVSVTAICRPGSPHNVRLPVAEGLRIVECDAESLNLLAERLPTARGGAFFHLAWNTASREVAADPVAQARSIVHTLDAVRLADRLGCSVFVGAGSQAEYGPAEGRLGPDTPTHPQTPYGIAKLAAGRLSRALCASLGLRHNWCRILSIYGPYDSERTAVMYCIRTLLRGERPVFTPCEQKWDYLYCEDAARALCLVAERGVDGVAYPIGSGEERPLRDYFEIIRDRMAPSRSLGIGERPYAAGQTMRLCADLAALRRDTGFQPTVRFEDGIAETIAWAKSTL